MESGPNESIRLLSNFLNKQNTLSSASVNRSINILESFRELLSDDPSWWNIVVRAKDKLKEVDVVPGNVHGPPPGVGPELESLMAKQKQQQGMDKHMEAAAHWAKMAIQADNAENNALAVKRYDNAVKELDAAIIFAVGDAREQLSMKSKEYSVRAMILQGTATTARRATPPPKKALRQSIGHQGPLTYEWKGHFKTVWMTVTVSLNIDGSIDFPALRSGDYTQSKLHIPPGRYQVGLPKTPRKIPHDNCFRISLSDKIEGPTVSKLILDAGSPENVVVWTKALENALQRWGQFLGVEAHTWGPTNAQRIFNIDFTDASGGRGRLENIALNTIIYDIKEAGLRNGSSAPQTIDGVEASDRQTSSGLLKDYFTKYWDIWMNARGDTRNLHELRVTAPEPELGSESGSAAAGPGSAAAEPARGHVGGGRRKHIRRVKTRKRIRKKAIRNKRNNKQSKKRSKNKRTKKRSKSRR